MQSRSATWQNITAGGDFSLEAVAVINGTQYEVETAPVINRGMSPKMLSIGNCVAACLRLELRTNDTIARAAEVQMIQRVVSDPLGSPEYSEWLSAGTFYVSERDRDYASGKITLTCYDAMLKTREKYFPGGIVAGTDIWPKPMSTVVDIIADRIGVDIDSRTVINTGDDYMVYLPSYQSTMMDVLGQIAIVHGGNWIITAENKLRLIPLQGAPEDGEEGVTEVPAVLSSLSTGHPVTVSKITMTNGSGENQISYSAGDDTGYEIKIENNMYASQAMCNRLLLILGGITYNPFQMRGAIFDPALEIGDKIRYADSIGGVVVQMDSTLNVMFKGDIIAPEDKEIVDEYPYENAAQQAANEIRERADSGEFDGVVMRIDSTRGLVFKNSWYNTQLRVTIIKGPKIITDLQALRAQFGSGAYLQWYFRKQVDQEWSTMSVSDSRITEGGFCLTVTPDDVDEQITFQCDLVV